MGTGPEAVLDSELGVHGLSVAGCRLLRDADDRRRNTNVPGNHDREKAADIIPRRTRSSHFDEWRVEIERVLRWHTRRKTLQPIACTT